MNDDQLVDLMTQTDPYPTARALPGVMTSSAVLHGIERRTSMDIKEIIESPQTRPRSRTGLLVAAAAFALVVIVGVGMALLALPSDDEQPPATDQVTTTVVNASPTTTSASATTDPDASVSTTSTTPEPSPVESVAVAQAMLDAHAAGDIEQLTELVVEGAVLDRGPINENNERYDIAKLHINAAHSAAIGRRIEIVRCEGDALLRCDVAITDAFSDGLGLESVPALMRFSVSDGRVTLWQVVTDDIYDLPRMVALIKFETWHLANYPDDPIFYSTRGAQDHYYWPEAPDTPELAALRIQEYLATLNG